MYMNTVNKAATGNAASETSALNERQSKVNKTDTIRLSLHTKVKFFML